jgi:hypothetical protein
MEPLGISQSEVIVRLTKDEVAELSQPHDTEASQTSLGSEFADLTERMATSDVRGRATYKEPDYGPKPLSEWMDPDDLAELVEACTPEPLPREYVMQRHRRRRRLGGAALSDPQHQ